MEISNLRHKIVVDDAATIRALATDERIDRRFVFWPPLNGLLLGRLLRNLSYQGTHFPHMTPKNDAARITRYTQLWEEFNTRAAAMANGAEELEPLAAWIRQETDGEPGILVQQVIGSVFKPDFCATAESWQAAIALREDATSKNLPKLFWWQLTGKANRAKKLLGTLLDDDIVAMHGVAVAAHNLVATLRQLRALYATGERLTPEEAVEQTLSAPPVVYRQALAAGAVAGCPYSRFTLFLLKLKDANKGQQAKDMVFMSGTWSRCPAERWIPAVISGIWVRAQLKSFR
ncbi:hypothetical protein [Mucilaginibacter jinjuensis]|uniref:Uncharacterized protein n=1 Tax=Mucilaginibacter jinjuensis TaxID=1176721 RepID=A0ABY7T9T3_9SPHI|nr:hypothetical protein [Mucilaginibacter jinjuensis]WCT13244.1 hypothetical protein PQO05_04780 [Mucilaginibacter jinjuensis]